MTIDVGLSASIARVVGDEDTAIALGSGDVPVLATPRLIAWCEAATLEAVAGRLPAHQTTVGGRVEFDHLAPSAVGADVVVSARVSAVSGRRIDLDVEAVEAGRTVGRGTILRVIVHRQGFGA